MKQWVVIGALPLLAALGSFSVADAPSAFVYTDAQAERGAALYTTKCFVCHGPNLDDGQFASPLKGPAFRSKWGGQTLDVLYTVMITKMPPDNPGGLGAETYADAMAFLLKKNGFAATPDRELPANADAMQGMVLPE